MKRNFVELIEKRCSTQKSITQFKLVVVDIKDVELESTTLDQDVCFEKASDRGRASKDYSFRFTRFQSKASIARGRLGKNRSDGTGVDDCVYCRVKVSAEENDLT